MTESQKTRLIAWNHELRNVHERLREALRVTRAALREGDPPESLRTLEQDHSMIARLVGELQAAGARAAPAVELEHHLDGIAAIMDSHFRYEERQLLAVLEGLALQGDPHDVLGPL